MWKCPRCGRDILDKEYRFCPDCGTQKPEVVEELTPWICEKCKALFVDKNDRKTRPSYEWYQAGRTERIGEDGNPKPVECRTINTNFCPYCRTTRFKSLGQTMKEGEYISMGLYDQGKGIRPIEWIVLKEMEEWVLVMSRYVLAVKEFHHELEPVSWEGSSIRKWLNKDFIKMAFSELELEKIQYVIPYSYTIPDHYSPEGKKYPAAPPLRAKQDRVFLLSEWEVEKYLPERKDRICQPTLSSIGQGVVGKGGMLYSTVLRSGNDHGDGCFWWLRNPGFRDNYACYVNEEGKVDKYGDFCINNTIGIRPAMWIRKETVKQQLS